MPAMLGLSKRKSMFEYERGLIGDLQRMSAYVPRGNILCRFFKRPDSWAPQKKPWSTKKLRKQLGFNPWSPEIGPVRQSTSSTQSQESMEQLFPGSAILNYSSACSSSGGVVERRDSEQALNHLAASNCSKSDFVYKLSNN